jgi:membrane-bound lytic murein transglycosylase D
MKRVCLLAAVLVAPGLARTQTDTVTLDDLLQQGQQWLQENADENVLRALQQVDQARVQQFLQDIEQRFHGDYVVDLAQLRQAAATVLPLLEAHEETQPYAAWLRTRLDYLDVADEFRLTIPPPKVEPGQPALPIPNPGPAVERKVWQQRLEKRPAPAGSARLAAELKPVFAAQGVPAQLVWLAEVESSFNPTARSPVGAAGLFQLMPPTAKNLGLAARPDERLDPEKSARAAARYLKYLHDQFKDWPLALAAYNVGEGRLQKLLERYRARTFDQVATHLPAETQMYVPKIEAVLQRREGVTLAQLEISRAKG